MLLRAVSLLKTIINVSWTPVDTTNDDNKENINRNATQFQVNDAVGDDYMTSISASDRAFIKQNIFNAMYMAVSQLQSSVIISELENIFYNICQTDCGESNQWPDC